MIKITTKDLLKNFEINGQECIYKNNIPCIIDFHATWCKPCKTVDRVLKKLEKQNNDIIFYTIDVEEEYELAEIFSIKNLPTMILCSKNTDTIRLQGTVGESNIQSELNKLKIKEIV
jgi:thioredoxin-like negative regulator of GroEL